MTAREVALKALIACRRQGAWSDGALKEGIAKAGLSDRDAALASRLCYGVLQNRMLLDFYVDAFLTTPRSRLQPVTTDILRLGAYQLTMMDRIPASAAVNESVELAKKQVNPGAGKLVNGVLRAMTRAEALPEPDTLAVRYSHPQALVDLLAAELPPVELPALLAADNEPLPTSIQINPLKTTQEAAQAALEALGAKVEPHPWLPGCFALSGVGSLEKLELFRDGAIFVQDAAAHLAALAAELEPGERVLDCCAAPGGKSFAAAMQMEDRGSVISCDLHPHKIRIIEAGAARLGLTCVQAQVQDGTKHRPDWRDAFDCVIADVPCSGLGVIRKKPDIRYKELSALERLPEVQGNILRTQADYVRPGGRLIYSTCTVLRRENKDVVRAFLAERPDFRLELVPAPAGLDAPNTGMLTLWPHRHGTDGFFICRLRREP
ncbi:MAG: 16S rRNA (cytosine(967)-C(5))-methyltransferase RsmB [Oscillospiraceae bacterium]|nr:16S rRNA (cytosine(967)-C(5))-methyltransferase RsmB [Oscillospiraceae bacterium]